MPYTYFAGRNFFLSLLIVFVTHSLFGQEEYSDVLNAPDGIQYSFHWMGDAKAADPNEPIPPGYESLGTKGWISYAITHQLSKAKKEGSKFFEYAQRATGKTSLSGVMGVIISGCGYWLKCDGGTKDLQYTGENVIYRIFINTDLDEIYVGEFQDGNLIEVRRCWVGEDRFEDDPEPYEKPLVTGNPVCPKSEIPVTRVPDPIPPAPDTIPPVAKILASQTRGEVPLSIDFDGNGSYDPDGGNIVWYLWDFGDGVASDRAQPPTFFLNTPGEFPVSLIVMDDEGDFDTTQQTIIALAPPPPPKPEVCWTMSYTLRECGGNIDTLVKMPIQVPCPAPDSAQVIWIDKNCGEEIVVLPPAEDRRRLQLAGGVVFNRFRGQLPEYGLGANAQIRYRLGERRRWAVLLDASVLPSRRATPLDDRPYKWSPLRDSIDQESGLPLVWYRGSRRGTASLGVGAEFSPWPWLYIQGMGAVERTFLQEDISDPRKDPINQFVGFDLESFLYETRIGIRKDHLEIFIGLRLSEENRPFTLIPPNELGGSHNARMDKAYEAGVSIYY